MKYTNRYGDVYTFTKQEDGSVLWEGSFKWCRFGWPNVYKEAYQQYCKDVGSKGGQPMFIDTFKYFSILNSKSRYGYVLNTKYFYLKIFNINEIYDL